MGTNNVFHRGSGVAEGIDYGLSKTDHTGALRTVAPRITFGDPEWVKAVVRSMTCKQRYTAGVLSFAERKLTGKQKRQIIDEHLRVSFPGLDPVRIAAVYIEHQDKGMTELHYWIANIDLRTGKRLNAYYHRADGRRLRLWMQSLNDRLQLADPNDPARWRLYAPPKKDAPESRKTMQTKLLAALEKMALAGVVKCRTDIEAMLTQAGWRVSRRTKTFLSVTHQRIKMPVRLTGRMFRADWSGAVTPNVIQRMSKEWAAARSQRMRDTAAKLILLIEKRAKYNRTRFGGEQRDDPLLRELMAVRDTQVDLSPNAAMRELRADIEILQAKYGHGGVPLRAFDAQTRAQLTARKKRETLKPEQPIHRMPRPRL